MTTEPHPYTVTCPLCQATQYAVLLDTGEPATLREIRTTAYGLATLAHLPSCPRYGQNGNGKADPADCQAPLF